MVPYIRGLPIVNGVNEPEIMDGRVLQEVFRIVELHVDGGVLDAGHNAGGRGVQTILAHF